MIEKAERNQKIYNYHKTHINTSCVKIGKIFQHYDKDKKKVIPLHPSAVWRIIKRYEKKEQENQPVKVGD